MALTFSCPTCHKTFDASISVSGASYMDGNKVIKLMDAEDDCSECQAKVNDAIRETKAKIRMETSI